MRSIVLLVIFVVLMVLWLLGGGYSIYSTPGGAGIAPAIGTFVPWACVAILGWVVFGGMSYPVGPSPPAAGS